MGMGEKQVVSNRPPRLHRHRRRTIVVRRYLSIDDARDGTPRQWWWRSLRGDIHLALARGVALLRGASVGFCAGLHGIWNARRVYLVPGTAQVRGILL